MTGTIIIGTTATATTTATIITITITGTIIIAIGERPTNKSTVATDVLSRFHGLSPRATGLFRVVTPTSLAPKAERRLRVVSNCAGNECTGIRPPFVPYAPGGRTLRGWDDLFNQVMTSYRAKYPLWNFSRSTDAAHAVPSRLGRGPSSGRWLAGVDRQVRGESQLVGGPRFAASEIGSQIRKFVQNAR